MKCPYCGNEALESSTGNGDKELYVMEGDDCFSSNITYYKCVENPKHSFFCESPETIQEEQHSSIIIKMMLYKRYKN